MNGLNLIITISFSLAALSFIAGFLGFDKPAFTYIFIFSFYGVGIGIVLKIIDMARTGHPEFNGMALCAIGFLISSLNFLVEYASLNPLLGGVLTWIGAALMMVGVLVYLVKRGRQ